MSGFVVYEAWAGRECLYVGMTSKLSRRLDEHRKNRIWHHRLTHLRLHIVTTRERARQIESSRITALRPRHNIQGNPRYYEYEQAIWSDSIRERKRAALMHLAWETEYQRIFSGHYEPTPAMRAMRAALVKVG